MKTQTSLILGIVFALIVAIFAVVNVDPVTVNYLFGKSQWPLIVVILSSVLMGGLIVGSVGFVKIYNLQKEVKALTLTKLELEGKLAEQVEDLLVISETDFEENNNPKTEKDEDRTNHKKS